MHIQTPPLGWNTWNTYGHNISEALVLESAQAMVDSGLKDAGYEYVVIDDTWQCHARDAQGRLVPDPEKFPHGIKYVADKVHAMGLKLGIYSCVGFQTCGGYPGSYDHEWIDARTFAEWEVDFLKYDYCFRATSVDPDTLYKRMGLALANCGRDIVFSACSWGSDNTKVWIKETGAHMWRSTGDITDSWQSIKSLAQSQIVAQEYNGQGCFNDMDMLVVGMNGKGHVGLTGCTTEEYKLHFSLWALLGSPLMFGCDIRSMDAETKNILTNREILAINQDPAARQPFFVGRRHLDARQTRTLQEPFYANFDLDKPILAKFLDNGDIALGFFNFTDETVPTQLIAVTADKLGLSRAHGKSLELTDLWTGERFSWDNEVIRVPSLEAHCCRMLRAKVVDR